WGEPFNLGPGVNSAFNEYSPAPSPDGTAIYFASNRHSAPAASGPWRATVRELDATTNYDLFVARCAESKHSANANDAPPMDAPVFGDAVALDALNTEAHEGTPAVSPAGDFLYFTSNRAGGQGGFDL